MNVTGPNTSPALRLVRPADAVQPPAAPRQATPPQAARSTQQADRLNFEAVYRSRLPRVAMTDAHARLEKLRTLVAARTDVPIHFDPPPATTPARANPSNPYAQALRFPVNPADLNERAVEAN